MIKIVQSTLTNGGSKTNGTAVDVVLWKYLIEGELECPKQKRV